MRALIVEDDDTTADHIAASLAADGWVCARVARLSDGLDAVLGEAVDLLVLDRTLPDGDGLSLLKKARDLGFTGPVLVLSALGTTEHRVEGIDSGADDYLPKPFEGIELRARARALVRRAGRAHNPEVLICGDLELLIKARTAHRQGQHLKLSPKEFDLIRYLVEHAGDLVTRDMLLKAVWKLNFDPGTNVVDVHMSRLRRKIEDGLEPPILTTLRGEGYRLTPAPAASLDAGGPP
jgi:two-component system, OmpR family, response regulator